MDIMEQRELHVTKDIANVTASGTPGSIYIYSNSATMLLGYIMERNLKMPWEEIMAEYLLSPLGMETSPLPFGLFTGESVIWPHSTILRNLGNFCQRTAIDPSENT